VRVATRFSKRSTKDGGERMLNLPRVMGHRGAAALAPENTLGGFRRAAATGVRWVEFDVMLTGDGVPVLFHDDNLKRITGRDALMAETPYSVVRTLDAGTWFAPDFAGERIATLEAAIAVLAALHLSANIEIKPTPGRDRETAAAIADVLVRCWPAAAPPPLISSFSRDALVVMHERAPALPRGWLCMRLPRNWLSVARGLECATVHVAGKWLTAKRAARIKAAGYGLATFTINDPKRARTLLDWGVDSIITDSPDVMIEALG
jgi:glycerophosphoryl diester phosphodiesterase